MTLNEILNLSSSELSDLSEDQLRKIATTLRVISNKRIANLVSKGLATASLSINRRKLKSGKIKPFEVKLKKSLYPKYKKHPKRAYSKNEKIRMDMRIKALAKKRKSVYIQKIGTMKSFIQSPSSTISGARQVIKRATRDMGKAWDSLSTYQKNRFWDVYALVRENNPDLFDESNKYYLKYREALFDIMLLNGKTPRLRNDQDAISMMEEYLRKGYVEKKPSTSSPFSPKIQDWKIKIF